MRSTTDLNSDQGEFWNHRYVAEGAIWGEQPSPTAQLAIRHVHHEASALDVGFGYGRDLVFLAQNGCRVSGIDLSGEGRKQALIRLQRMGIGDARLAIGHFEDHPLEASSFDLVLSHRLAHLLVDRQSIARFAAAAGQALRPGGLLCVGARNREDLDPAEMIQVDDDVHEYRRRPGHRIRYWSDSTFREVFGRAFTILALDRAVEDESRGHPIPCHFTIMLARRNDELRGELRETRSACVTNAIRSHEL